MRADPDLKKAAPKRGPTFHFKNTPGQTWFPLDKSGLKQKRPEVSHDARLIGRFTDNEKGSARSNRGREGCRPLKPAPRRQDPDGATTAQAARAAQKAITLKPMPGM